jgi:hypothetical protein
MKFNGMLFVVGLALAAVGSTAKADVPWANPSGSNSVLSWENGRSDNGRFGSPTVVADTFFFISNSNFDAFASDGSSDTRSDTLRVRVRAQPGRFFSQVIFASQGDYTVVGQGASVDVNGMLTINDLNSPRTASDAFHTTVTPNPGAGNETTMPVHGSANLDKMGIWTGQSMISFDPAFGQPPVTELDLIFTNTLIAIAMPGETASILTLPNTQGSFSLSIVPAPATGLAGLLGLGMFARRRR